jgi:small subunit ribosomal protein S8
MDKISEMLTKIRNAQMAGHAEVTINFSNLKFTLAKILASEGFIESVAKGQNGSKSDFIKLKLKYLQISNTKKIPAIKGLKRLSRSGQRIYVGAKQIRDVKNKFGISIISTSKGIMTGAQSRKIGLGGEYLCEIW